MSDGKVQSPVDLTETQQQTIPRTETNRHQNSIRKIRNSDRPADNSRRSFMGKAGGLTAMAVAAAMVPFEPLVGGKETEAAASDITYSESNRANLSFNYRDKEAQAEKVSPPVAADNGDFALYTDHSGAWSKTLQHINSGDRQSNILQQPDHRSYEWGLCRFPEHSRRQPRRDQCQRTTQRASDGAGF